MRKFYIPGLIILVVLIIGLAWAEQWTFSTYYPSPYGVYQEFTTTGKTCLATNPLPDPLNPLPNDDPKSMVGIGTENPQAKLEVQGGATMATDGLIMEVRSDDPALPEPGRMFLVGATAIYTPEDLQNISPNGNYYLAQDIECVGFDFSPIAPFYGRLDGRGCSIKNLTINRPAVTYVGLFRIIHSGSRIENVGLENVDIRGSSYIGALVGHQRGGIITNCHATGTVRGGGFIGGFVGMTAGGTISNCYSTANVLTGANLAGGLVGYLSSGVIRNSFARGDVTSTISYGYNGGFVGHGGGTIINCYSTGAVYAAGSSFIGNSRTGLYIGNFVDTDTSSLGTTWSTHYGCPIPYDPATCEITGKTTIEMQNLATFTDTSTAGLSSPWDFVNDPHEDTGGEDFWTIDPLGIINDGYPYLLPVSASLGGPYIDIGLRVHCGGSMPVNIAISPDQPPTSPLRIRQGGVTHGIALRSVGPNEPGIKIRTNSELMALIEQ